MSDSRAGQGRTDLKEVIARLPTQPANQHAGGTAAALLTTRRGVMPGHILLTPVAPRHPEDELMQTNLIESRAVEVFGDRDKAMRWLSKPKRSLGGLPPLTAAATPAGAKVVVEMLERIANGFFA